MLKLIIFVVVAIQGRSLLCVLEFIVPYWNLFWRELNVWWIWWLS